MGIDSHVMKWRRAIRNVVLGTIVALVMAAAIKLGQGRWKEHRLAQRLEHIDRALATVRVTRSPCASRSNCECQVESASDALAGCSVIDGHVALLIRSNDTCFAQWIAIDSTWVWDGSAERIGVLWISQRPRVVTSRWSVLAVAPCLD